MVQAVILGNSFLTEIQETNAMVSCALISCGFGFGSSWSVAEPSRPCISDSPVAVLKSEQAVGRDGWLPYLQGSSTAAWISRWHSVVSHGPQTIGAAPLPVLFQTGGLWRENGICLFCSGLSSSAFPALGLLFPSGRHFPAMTRVWRWAQPALVCCFMIHSDLVVYTTLLFKLSPISNVEWDLINTVISDTSWSFTSEAFGLQSHNQWMTFREKECIRINLLHLGQSELGCQCSK